MEFFIVVYQYFVLVSHGQIREDDVAALIDDLPVVVDCLHATVVVVENANVRCWSLLPFIYYLYKTQTSLIHNTFILHKLYIYID